MLCARQVLFAHILLSFQAVEPYIRRSISVTNGDVTLSVNGPSGSSGVVTAICSHTSVLPGFNSEVFQYAVCRVLDVGDGWMVLGFGTSQVDTQEAISITVVPSKPQDVWVEVQKTVSAKCAQGNPLFQDLSGIKFNVIDKSTGEIVDTLVTDLNGYAKFKTLAYNDKGFDIVEIFIPDGLPV